MEFLADGKTFRVWVEQQGIWGPLTLIGIMALQVVIAIIPGEAVEIGAGYAFGAIPGMFLCLAGAAVGSVIIYGLTKSFGIRMVEAFISREKLQSLKFLQNTKKLNLLIFILFFIPGTPKDPVSYTHLKRSQTARAAESNLDSKLFSISCPPFHTYLWTSATP